MRGATIVVPEDVGQSVLDRAEPLRSYSFLEASVKLLSQEADISVRMRRTE